MSLANCALFISISDYTFDKLAPLKACLEILAGLYLPCFHGWISVIVTKTEKTSEILSFGVLRRGFLCSPSGFMDASVRIISSKSAKSQKKYVIWF